MNIAHRFEQVYTGAVYDIMRSKGYRACALPPEIRPLDHGRRLAGQIYTVVGHRDDSLDAHATLLQWTSMLSKAPADSVVICQPNDSTVAHMGELSAEVLKLRGIRGYIVDGGCRDTEFILRIGFPVFCRYLTPQDIVGRWIADEFGPPITIGEVTIHTGDYVVADRDGVVIVPQSIADEVLEEAERLLNTENLIRTAILGGMDPQQAYLKHGAF